jgi:hypothetical protein
LGAAFAEYYDETFPAKRQMSGAGKLDKPHRLDDRAFDNVSRNFQD